MKSALESRHLISFARSKKLVDWKEAVEKHPGIAKLNEDVIAFASSFGMPGRPDY